MIYKRKDRKSMKLYINNSNYITEAIDDIKKYYPRIPDDVFMQLIQLDPTYRGNDSAGKYGKWLLNLYNKGNLSEEEFSEVTPLLNQFTTYRNRIQNKDLNSYKSLSALADVLADVVDDDSMLTNRQKVRFLKNVKSGKVKTSAEDDYDVVLETPNFIVYVPNTHEASMMLGKRTGWCTAHENPEWYDAYTENGGKLYIIKNKKTGERWQYSDLKGEFLDEDDDNFNIPELMRKDEKLSKFFEKFLGADYYNFDGTLVYNGRKIPESIKPSITKVIIDNSVTSIGYNVFLKCVNLKNVIIPNSVKSIRAGAFDGCISLKNITIPNSVTYIEEWAFCGCTGLEIVTIPDSVTSIIRGAFDGCINLTIYTNNNYVKRYCNKNSIPVKPLNNNESINKNKRYKLHIKETYELKRIK